MGVMKRIRTATQLRRKIPTKVLAAFEITPQEEPADDYEERYADPLPVVDPTITPPWVEVDRVPEIEPTRPEPVAARPNPLPRIEEADDAWHDGPPTSVGCADGWYRTGEVFYRVGRGPHPGFGIVSPAEVESRVEEPVFSGATKQGFLF